MVTIRALHILDADPSDVLAAARAVVRTLEQYRRGDRTDCSPVHRAVDDLAWRLDEFDREPGA